MRIGIAIISRRGESESHRIEVIHPSGVPQAKACQLIFVASSDKQQVREILRGLRGASVLTVGDTAGFARMGGTINFVLDEAGCALKSM